MKSTDQGTGSNYYATWLEALEWQLEKSEERRTSSRRISQKVKDEEILELYDQKLTNREIAKKLNVSIPTIDYRLMRLGLKNNCWRD